MNELLPHHEGGRWIPSQSRWRREQRWERRRPAGTHERIAAAPRSPSASQVQSRVAPGSTWGSQGFQPLALQAPGSTWGWATASSPSRPPALPPAEESW